MIRGRESRAGFALLLGVAVLWLAGCGGNRVDRSSELQSFLDAGRYDDALAQVRVFREAGESGPVLDFAQGIALLHQNADKLAVPYLQRAVAADSTLRRDSAEALTTLAWADNEEGWKDRAARRMKAAYLIDSTVELGELKDAVADLFFRYDEDFEHAYEVYHQLYRERDGPEDRVKEWVYRYGFCLEKTGSPEAARSVYEEFRRTFPKDRNMLRFVNWRYMSMLMDDAGVAAERGQSDEALSVYQKALDVGWHNDLQQEIRYRMGMIEKGRGDFEAARDHFTKVVETGSEFGGEFVALSESALEDLGSMGVH